MNVKFIKYKHTIYFHMYILMISRGIPSKYHPQWGCFEKDQAEALASIGHKVIVMSVDGRFNRHRGKLGLHKISQNGVEYYNEVVLPAKLFTKTIGADNYINHIKFRYYKKVFKIILKDHGFPDVIYSQFFPNTVMGVKLKDSFKIPVIGIEHLSKFNELTFSKHDDRWARYAYENCNAGIAVSHTLAHNLSLRYNRQFEVIHNMYGAEFQNTNNSWNIKPPLRFISTASLIKRKGFDALIEAFAVSEIPTNLWRLDIIGWGEEKTNLENLIKQHNLTNNIHLLGKMDKPEIVNQLKHSNIFVLPSRNENFSVAVLEALAMGLPVLATDCGGIKECINEKNGIIVPVDDIKAMTSAIKEVINNYNRFDRNYIVKDCQNRFSPKSIAKRLTEVFENVLNTDK